MTLMKKSLLILSLLALFPLHSRAQDTSVKPLQGWLDFLVSNASLSSVVARIGGADTAKSVNYLAPNAQMYIWENRFYLDSQKTARLELVAVPDGDPANRQMIVIAIIDPARPRGIYLPWAGRYVDTVPHSNYIPRGIMQALLGY